MRLVIFSQSLPFYSLLPTPYSLLPILYSLFSILYSLLPIPYSLFSPPCPPVPTSAIASSSPATWP
ncbi:hypothetical protein FBQ83_07175 [Chloroflexi bacterium CFX5]|nr:hypothetical protein [Chloroflexi bacterium CFX5]